MCGIAGIVSAAGISRMDSAVLGRMGDLLAHRGPDGHGRWAEGPAALAHRRLRVQGDCPQPLVRGDLALAYNGELYDVDAGSDTERVLDLYERHGVGMFERMNGMFALALWDGRQRRLILARDRFGEKPLYWAPRGDGLAFASEAKAFRAAGPLAADEAGLAQYRALQMTVGERTLFRGVRRVEPATWVAFDAAGRELERATYWKPPAAEPPEGPGHVAAETLWQLAKEAVTLRLLSDRSAGCYLSGGLDSSTVAALSGLPAYHGYFTEPGYSELEYARAAASGPLGDVAITHRDFERELRRVVWHLDEPCAGPGAFAEFVVARTAALDGRVVMLSGVGGDEVFGGYARQRMIAGAPAGYVPLERAAYGAMVARDGTVADVGDAYRGGTPLERSCRWEIAHTLPALLHVSDRVGMAHGIETRAPLLDYRLVEHVFRSGDSLRWLGGEPKGGLRYVAKRAGVPQKVLTRRDKLGFPVPLKEWAAGPLRGFVSGVIGRSPEEMSARELWGGLSLAVWADEFGLTLPETLPEAVAA